ncbi:unnamed protein product [Didymodactylos carnosus]|uniref:Uncharacterized protein n=1 Tax=Didymodactylos carnosus TaxID=1234261 RepID=A0A813YJL4_9BILA|nr:unnamed protein product [Didymodactylos carnosus]CAF0885294.1 unnamed protein product [Didymodactylos carnosus]CAF3621317.1 unnamed protein product [Didymodactylos carnosus]CAF3670678.1 unnamed protein product [Didymodactylos carnosus]
MIKQEKPLLWPCFCFKSSMTSFQTPLHAAVKNCNIDWTRKLLICGACVNVVDHYGKNVLHYAIELYDQLDIIRLILKTNIDINARDKVQLRTPLHYAVENNQLIIVQLLLKAGASVDIVDNKYGAPIQLAARNGYIDLFKLLLDADSQNTVRSAQFYPATHLAAMNGFYELYWIMFNKYNISVNLRDQAYSTVLHYVAKRGDLEEVKRLVLGGANVNLLDNRSWNALQYAVRFDFTSVAVYLIENGTVENRRCCQHELPLYLGALHLHTETLKALISVYRLTDVQLLWDIVLRSSIIHKDREKIIYALEMGARLDSFSTQIETLLTSPGLTAMHLAVEKSSIDIIILLLQQPQANVNMLDQTGRTLLHHCAIYNREDILNLLVDHYHADINALTNKNENAFFLALSSRNFDFAKSLLNRGSKIDFNQIYGANKTLLEHAIVLKAIYFVQLFLKMDANPNLSYNIDNSPMRLAIDAGSVEIIHSLIDNGADINEVFKFHEPDKGPRWQSNDPFRVRYHEWRIFSFVAFKCKSKIMKYLIEEHTTVNPSWQTDITIIDALAKGILLNQFENLVAILETLVVLLKAGYKINIQEKLTGKTLVHILYENIITCMKTKASAIDLILTLSDFNANFNTRDSFHRTALHIIASTNHHHLYQILLQLGAVKSSIDIDGHTSEDIAMLHAGIRGVSILR